MVAAGVEWRAFFLVRLEGIACVSIVVRGSGRRGGAEQWGLNRWVNTRRKNLLKLTQFHSVLLDLTKILMVKFSST
jgi:hypothetical protein